ncbi:MAG: 16S rRNA (cytosine(967)-C(5))-methyltransferase RsmB [Longimicrobiaceae bacterium]
MLPAASPGRRAALQVLRDCHRGELLDRSLARRVDPLPERERGWTRELVYGTLRLRGRLDFLLGRVVRGGLSRLQPDVLEVMRLGAYQLLEMGSVPAYAAISQSVELARAAGVGHATGLVNAALRALAREGGGIDAFPPFEQDPVGHLVHYGSHPEWLVKRWVARWGAEEAAGIVGRNNRRPAVFLRPVGVSPEEARARLAERGIDSRPPLIEAAGCLWLDDASRVAEALAAVPAVVQDPSAALVVRYASVPPGARVVDLCAAPGGKAAGLAGEGRRVVAADLSLRRLGRVRENVSRLSLQRAVFPVCADGRTPPFRQVDAVLLDAPCTGTGTLARHPDGKWRLGEHSSGELAGLQRELLAGAAEVVRPGGLLLYATCSLEEEENEAQVSGFLAEHQDFRVEPPGRFPADLLDGCGLLTLLPQRSGTDGSFAARLRKDG